MRPVGFASALKAGKALDLRSVLWDYGSISPWRVAEEA